MMIPDLLVLGPSTILSSIFAISLTWTVHAGIAIDKKPLLELQCNTEAAAADRSDSDTEI
jgi:hypothetical protein